MLYHPQENIISKIVKIIAFGTSLFVMIWLSLLVLVDDIKIPQKEISLKIDLKNKINICLPEETQTKEHFFNF
jgi:hypothetical protein